MNWTVGPPMRFVYIATLQHVIFNPDSTIIEDMVRDRSRTTGLIICSVLNAILEKYVQRWMREDASNVDGGDVDFRKKKKTPS